MNPLARLLWAFLEVQREMLDEVGRVIRSGWVFVLIAFALAVILVPLLVK